MARSLVHMTHKERLMDLDMFSLTRRVLMGNLIVAYNYSNGSYKSVKRQTLFGNGRQYRKGGTGTNCGFGRFRLDIRRKGKWCSTESGYPKSMK